MLELIPKIPAYMAMRRFGWPTLLPLNLVFSVTYRCNSRCRTCNIWRHVGASAAPGDELALDECERIFASIGRSPYYLTFSGGEPFLRRDLADVVAIAYHHCRPSVITIPTNGLLAPRIPGQVEKILEACPAANVIVNVSVDSIGAEHDAIRGVKGSFDSALRTLEGLRSLKHPRLVTGLHTVVSRFNVDRLPEIYDHLAQVGPESLITEVAEERLELGTMGTEITPSVAEYDQAAKFLIARAREQRASGFARVTRAFRLQYYGLAARTLAERRQVLPCYAGFASGHISPDGDVWTCCTRAEPLGNLREAGYNFPKVWRGEKAAALRRSIKRGECYCPMANASYTNMLLDPKTMLKVSRTAVG